MLDIKLIEEASVFKLKELMNQPIERLSQKERLKVTRLAQTHPNLVDKSQPKKDLILVVVLDSLYLTKCHKLRYVYHPRPTLQKSIHVQDSKKLLSDVIEALRSQMGLSEQFRALFTKSGKKLSSVLELMDGELCFVLTSMLVFKGLYLDSIHQNPVGMKLVNEVGAAQQIAKLEYPLLRVDSTESGGLRKKTIEKSISTRYGKLKNDIIEFACMGEPGLDSHQLQDLYRKSHAKQLDVKDLDAHIERLEPNGAFFQPKPHNRANFKNKNLVLESLRAADPACFDGIHQHIQHQAQDLSHSIRQDSEDRYLDTENWVKGKRPDHFDKARDMYVERQEPLIASKQHLIVDLLFRKYLAEVRQGTLMEDEDTRRHKFAMEMAVINGKDPHEIGEGSRG